MGVSSTVNRVVYSGDGTTTTFSFPYYFFFTTDLNVYLYDTIAGGAVLQTLGTNYTISGTPNNQGLYNNGASVVFGTAPVATSQVVILRNPAELQNYSLTQNGLISSTALVQQMDYLTLEIQRLNDLISRAPTLADGMGPAFTGGLPSTAALMPGSYIQVNSTGNGFILAPSPSTGVVFPYSSFTSGGSSLSVTLATLPPGSTLQSLAIKHSIAFTGVSDVYASLGVSGNTGAFIPDFDLTQAVGDQVFDNVSLGYIGSWASSTPILLTLTAASGSLSSLTAGSVSVYYKYALL